MNPGLQEILFSKNQFNNMIQRIQTIWLFLAAVAAFLSIQFPFYLIKFGDSISAANHLLILIISSALGTGILITIFLFKHRKLQIRLSLLCALIECLVIFLYMREVRQNEGGSFALSAILHPLILLLLILAIRGIYKDAKLIKESNRIR